MTNRSRLISGRVPTSNSANVTSDRYQFLDLSSAEPNLGTANTGDILTYNSNYPGGRQWISANTIQAGNTQGIYDKANSANVLAQAAYNQANSASANTVVLAAIEVAQNANISIALAGVAAANANISFVTGFSQGAYDKANAANVLAQAAYNQANTAANAAFVQAAYDKANSANVLAQAAYDNSNTKFSSSGGNINGDVNIINSKNLTVTGNLTVQGNLISTNTQQFTVADPLIVLGLGNYTNDLKDIGFVSHYNDGVNAHTGFFRDSGTKEWYLFKGYTPEVDSNNNIDIADASFKTSNLNASIVKANLVGTTAVVNNIELGAFTQAAYNFANSANVLAQAAYNAANAAGSSTYVQGAYNQANSANVLAQAAYNQANTAGANTIVLAAINVAQNANIAIALAGLTAANVNIAIAQAGVVAANSNISYLINTFVPAAYNAANTAQLQALNAFGFAQGAYNQANSAYGIALSAALEANVANSIANTALQNTASIVTSGNLTVSNNLTVTNNVTAAYISTTGIGGSISGANTISANTVNAVNIVITSNTVSNSNTTGALLVTGGVGVQGNLYATAVYSNNKIVLTSEPIGQGAYDKANAANVLAQAAFDYANASSGGALAQSAFNKANSANVLAQAAYNAANAAVQSSGGTITGTLNVANLIETGKIFTVAGNTSYNANSLLANSGIAVGKINYLCNSIFFNGSSDYLTLNPGVTIGTNAYTVEFWMYLTNNNITSAQGIIGTNTTNAFNLRLNSNTQFQIDDSFVGGQTFTVPTLQANTWYHIAAVRDVSSRETLFVNGVRSSTGYVTDSNNFSGPTNEIAADVTVANYTPYLSNIRIVNGNTLYDPTQSTITVPTALLTPVSNTQLLAAQYGVTYDASGIQTITVSGTPTATQFSGLYIPSAITFLYDGANNWLTYGGINAASFYSNGINVLNFAQAAFNYANNSSGGITTFTQAAYDKANAALSNTGSLITVNSVSQLYVSNTTPSTSNTTGALTVAGGVGIQGSLYTGNVTFVSATGNSAGFGTTLIANTSNANTFVVQLPSANGTLATLGALTQTFAGAITISGAQTLVGTTTMSGAVTMGASTGAINLGTSLTTGTMQLGGTNQTSSIGIGRSANTSSVNIANGAMQYANTKTVTIGTGGLVGSNTNINIGSDAGNTTVNFGLNTIVNIQNTSPTSLATSGGITVAGNVIINNGLSVSNINIIPVLQNSYDKANTTATVANSTAVVANVVAAGLVATNTNTAIALAGVAAANSNISFLTGFSQGAYDKANTTATVANSTAVVANIVAAGLVSANSNISFLTGFSQGAYDKANTTATVANSTAVVANIVAAGLVSANSNISFLTGFSQGAYDKANSANVLAQAAYDNSNTKFSSSGGNINGDVFIINNKNLTVTGNLTVQGNLVSTNTQSFTVADPLIVLGLGNYTSDLKDIGFVSHYNDGVNAHTGFFRDSGTKEWYLFKGYVPEVDANNDININDATFKTANLNASIVKANLVGTTVTTNNIELGGFTQAAYNAANIATAGVVAANSNISFLIGFSQGAYDKANTGNSAGQAAFNKANTAVQNTSNIILTNLSLNGNLIVFGNITDTGGNTTLKQDSTGNVVISGGLSVSNINIIPVLQNSYDKANTTATVANSTAVVANIVAAGLVATNTNTAIALAGVAAANSNILFLTGFSQGAYNKANTAVQNTSNIILNNLSLNGNLIVFGNITDTGGNTALKQDSAGNVIISGNLSVAGSANITGNLIVFGNITDTGGNTTLKQDSAGNVIISGGLSVSNINIIPVLQNSYDKANAANVLAQAAYNYANTISGGNAVDSLARDKANSANVLAQYAADKANAAFAYANTIGGGNSVDSYARIVANSTAIVANIVAAGLVSTNTNTAIALAGVTAANANISFLTGFSQGAYDKANTTATVANSTAIVANVVAAGLVATNTNTAIALAGVAAANSNISFLIGFSQGAYDKANSASGGANQAQAAFDKANSANVLAQSAFDKANTGGIVVTTSTAPPTSGNVAGAQWYNTTNDTLYEYTTSDGVYYYWIDIQSPTAVSSNATTVTGVSSGKAIAYALIFGG
jgi:hypothetical protein